MATARVSAACARSRSGSSKKSEPSRSHTRNVRRDDMGRGSHRASCSWTGSAGDASGSGTCSGQTAASQTTLASSVRPIRSRK
ncbi:MAG: hypothetical protein M5U28_21545 [Sandaracinaceae bacterium]|nr:hypothetical protein [Sandaracinaceae bacterium]